MDPFVRRLIQRLHDPAQPLSRNRHFHTFDNPQGRLALRTSKRLKTLQRDILRCHAEGFPPRVSFHVDEEGQHRIELRFENIQGRRTSLLRAPEFELLNELPGVKEALRGAAERS